MNTTKNSERAGKRNRLKGNFFAINNLLTFHQYQDYLYPDEQSALARIVIETRKLLLNWIPESPRILDITEQFIKENPHE